MSNFPKPTNYLGFHRGNGDESVGEVAEFLVGGGSGTTSPRALHIAASNDAGADWNISTQTDPRVFIHSATTPVTDYISIRHTGVAGIINSAGGGMSFQSGSGTSVVINDDSTDSDFRIEGNNNANMVVLDAGQDALSFGGANVDGAAMTFNNLTARTLITAVGLQAHYPAQTIVIDNVEADDPAVGAVAYYGVPTINNCAAPSTDTVLADAATVWIAGAPVAGTKVTGTSLHSLMVETGDVTLGVVGGSGATLSFSGTTGQTTVFASGACPTAITYTLPSDSPSTGEQLTSSCAGALSWAAHCSIKDHKDIYGETCKDLAFSRIVEAPVYDWNYKDDRKGKSLGYGTPHNMVGIMADESPWAMQGVDNAHFSAINSFGHLTAAFQVLVEKVQVLESQAS